MGRAQRFPALRKMRKPLPAARRSLSDSLYHHWRWCCRSHFQAADNPDEEAIHISQSKYLNNLIEQNHRNIKRRSRPILGFKSFRRAQTILDGIELLHMIRKGQYQHLQSEESSPAEQFYLLEAFIAENATFAYVMSLMRQSSRACFSASCPGSLKAVCLDMMHSISK